MVTPETTQPYDRTTRALQWGVLGAFARLTFHSLMVLLIAALLALVLVDLSTLQLYYISIGEHFQPDWGRLLIHFTLSALIWGATVLAYASFNQRKAQVKKLQLKRVSVLGRGAVMLETLIILTPFLLLTSGLTQFGLNNTTNLLADLAAYQSARAAWLWAPEADVGRNGATEDDVRFRARTAAAFVLAPSAPTDFYIGRNFPGGSGPPFRRARTGVAASFRSGPGVTGQQEWTLSGNNWGYFTLGGSTNSSTTGSLTARSNNTTYAKGFDSVSFNMRAGRKCTQAWMALEDEFEIINENGQVGVQFTYKHNQVFPWFAWIFGGTESVAGRVGNYMPIQRTFTLPAQPSMR
jgi:hypothetical protein